MSIIGTIKKTFSQDEQQKKGASVKKISAKKESPKKEGGSFSASAKAQSAESGSLVVHPYVTEKTSALQALYNTYVFKVDRRATASEVKKAIQRKFSVTVTNVNVVNMPSKKIMVGAHEGRVPGFKKAMVTLKEGEKIDIGV
ncbi:50S ribosomal protein L23 [Candidatus Azambacteria bacterium]|nr:50S ribosomal protein L23 [Candidatus Azambacteria bacterium]